MDEKLMVVYLQKVWKPNIYQVAEEIGLTDISSLLIMDSFRAHTTDSVKGVLKENEYQSTDHRLHFKSTTP